MKVGGAHFHHLVSLVTPGRREEEPIVQKRRQQNTDIYGGQKGESGDTCFALLGGTLVGARMLAGSLAVEVLKKINIQGVLWTRLYRQTVRSSHVGSDMTAL